jgi:F420-dependent oxidoreductase-like protein
MLLRVFTEPQQGATYDDLLAVARRTEDCGFDAFFRSDHYLAIGDTDGLPGPTDAWVTLGALARETSRIRLGTMVTSATFRLPGPLAISVAQVDQMSAGRVELGIGAGWFEREHTAYGIPFPSARERFDRLAEQLEIITGLWTASTPFSFHGKHYHLEQSPGLPKPVQRPRPPVIVGGWGPRRTPTLAAQFADEYNAAFRTLAETAARFDAVRAAVARPIELSMAQTVVCGRTDQEIRRRAEAIGQDIQQLRERGLCGTPEEVAEKLTAFQQAGATRAYLQVLDLHDLDHLDLVAAEVAPQLA